ncbi:MAG: hypothetical protein PVI84_15105, partial [Syntrophobacterales bacterium]
MSVVSGPLHFGRKHQTRHSGIRQRWISGIQEKECFRIPDLGCASSGMTFVVTCKVFEEQINGYSHNGQRTTDNGRRARKAGSEQMAARRNKNFRFGICRNAAGFTLIEVILI